MKSIVRLTLFMLLGLGPLAGAPATGCPRVVEQAHVVIRAGHVTARALGIALCATADALTRVRRGQVEP